MENLSKGTQSLAFPSLPKTLAEFKALPQAGMESPYQTAAMFVIALSVYPKNPSESIAMINFLKGPEPLSPREINLIREQVQHLITEDITQGSEGNKEAGDGFVQEHKETNKE